MKKILQTILFIIFTYSFTIAQVKVSIMPNPQKIFVELGENKKYLNFDFLVKNNTSDTLIISKIVATVFDKHDHIIHQRFLDNNGTAPSIKTIPNRIFTPQKKNLYSILFQNLI